MQSIVEKHGKGGIVLDMDFSRPPALYESDIVVTDWSSIAYEFSLVTKRPSLLINTPPKVINSDYERFGIVATDISFRDRIGVTVNLDNVGAVAEIVNDMLASPDKFREKIDDLLRTEFYDPMQAAEVGGKYILNALISRSNKKAK